MRTRKLDTLFNPKTIAVIGASEDKNSTGYHIFRNLVGKGFNGIVYPVNPYMDGIQGVESYKTVNDIPRTVDLVMVADFHEDLLSILDGCGRKKIQAVILLAPDFRHRIKNLT